MGWWSEVTGETRDNLNDHCREFCSLMVKRDHEKETVEDLKQAFRVFDKAPTFSLSFSVLNYKMPRMEMDMCRHQN